MGIKKYSYLFLLPLFLLCAAPALAAGVQPDRDFSMNIPDGWETVNRDGLNRVNPAVKDMFECLDGPEQNLRLAGWKMEGGKVLGAFCVRHIRSGSGKTLKLLKESTGKSRDYIAGKFIDTFAGDIHAGYGKRGMRVTEMSGDLLEAGSDLIMVLDGKIQGKDRQLMRSTTVFLHGDSLVNVGVVYALDAPAALVKELDELPLSVTWKK